MSVSRRQRLDEDNTLGITMARHDQVQKKSRTRYFAVVATLSVTLILLLLVHRPREEGNAVSIGFVGFTNYESGSHVAIFIATNRTARPLRYSICVERKTDSGWPTYSGPLPHQGFQDVPAGRDFS